MSTTTLIHVKGAIEFSFAVSDWELARQIDQLLTKNAHRIVQPAAGVSRHNGNGRAKTAIGSPETKKRILQLLREKHPSRPFKMAEAATLIENSMGVGLMSQPKVSSILNHLYPATILCHPIRRKLRLLVVPRLE